MFDRVRPDLVPFHRPTSPSLCPVTSIMLKIAASLYALPLLMPYMIQWFTYNQQLPMWWAFVYVAAVFGASCAGSMFNYHSRLLTYLFGIRVRSAVTTLVYRKSLFVIMGRNQTTGMIVNLMSTDALVIMETLPNFMVGVLAPIQIAVTIGLLSRYIGPYGLVALAVAVVATPLVAVFASNIGRLRARMQTHSDSRLKFIKELMTAIRIVKFYAWEKPFLRHVDGARSQQLKYVRRIQLMRALLITILTNVASLGIGLTFFFYGLGHTMNLETTFSATTFLAMLRVPFNYLPMLLAYLGQYFNSFERITFFALCSETPPRSSVPDPLGDKGLRMDNATFSWETDISIAETRYLELEMHEAQLNQRIEMAPDSNTKSDLIAKLRLILDEKAYVHKIVNNLRLTERKKARKQPLAGRFPLMKRDTIAPNGVTTKGTMKWAAAEAASSVEAEEWSGLEEIFPEEKAKFQPLRSVQPHLHHMDVQIRYNRLTAVVGSVGSGKSTLGLAFLGELRPTSGAVYISSNIAYASQEAWILNATVRDNITFGQPYDPTWYAKVIQACALVPDIASFNAGDQTEIGERGSNLSGGQRQRINVARAMYSKAPVVILDDPFSAVDAHVAAHMFEHVALGMRDAGRTVLLITNQLQIVPEVDYVIVLKAGRIAEQGTIQSLLRIKDGYLKKMLGQQVVHKNTTTNENEKEEDIVLPEAQKVSTKNRMGAPFIPLSPEEDAINKVKGRMIADEDRKQGNIAFDVYWRYFKAGGLLMVALIFLMQSLRMASRVMGGIWLSWWADTKNTHGFSKGVYLGGYMAFVAGEALFTLIGSFAFLQFAMGAARVLHSRMMDSVSHAPISWYDRTPVGRILTRFSKDIDFIDIKLPQVVEQATAFGFILLAVAVSIAIGSPFVVILLVVAAIIFISLIFYYRPSSIQIQRLEATSRAPIYSHLTETLEGAATIRAYNMAHAFKIANMNKIDRNNVDFIALRYTASWYGITQDLVGSLFVALSTITLILVRTYSPNSINVSYMIYALSNMGSIASSLSDFSSSVTDLENKMNSAERVIEYCTLPKEAPMEIKATKPPESWPNKGAITFEDLTIKYSTDAIALNSVTCKIKSKERIGIVGRTGAGKSTLVTALFRTTEPSSGTIKIDGTDISKIGLFDLRSRLSIIPQTPQLFVGTVRHNLDPFEEHSDHELWLVLKMVRLREHVAALPSCLYEQIDEGGANFSVGQRQLLSMARCLLKGTKVLVLDEATSSVDVETDALLQTMLRNNFRECTVLTIAHRLNTIMDSDRIMVLDKGRIVEFDTPKNLLKKDTIFKSMVEATGPETSAYLKAIAFGEISFLDALAQLVDEEEGAVESSEAVPKSARFRNVARRQQSRLVLGYYRMGEAEVIAEAKAQASNSITRRRSSELGGLANIPSPSTKKPGLLKRFSQRRGDSFKASSGSSGDEKPKKKKKPNKPKFISKPENIPHAAHGEATNEVVEIAPVPVAAFGRASSPDFRRNTDVPRMALPIPSFVASTQSSPHSSGGGISPRLGTGTSPRPGALSAMREGSTMRSTSSIIHHNASTPRAYSPRIPLGQIESDGSNASFGASHLPGRAAPSSEIIDIPPRFGRASHRTPSPGTRRAGIKITGPVPPGGNLSMGGSAIDISPARARLNGSTSSLPPLSTTPPVSTSIMMLAGTPSPGSSPSLSRAASPLSTPTSSYIAPEHLLTTNDPSTSDPPPFATNANIALDSPLPSPSPIRQRRRPRKRPSK